MKAFLLKLAAIIVQHKLLAGIVAAAVVAGGVTTGVVVHNNNVNNNDVVVAENETKETKEKETTKKTVSLESLKVALKDGATVFYTDSTITNDLFTVIGVYSDKSEKELTEFTITPVELVVGENTINFVVKDNGKDVSVDFAINVVEKPIEDNYTDSEESNINYNYEEPNYSESQEYYPTKPESPYETYYIDGCIISAYKNVDYSMEGKSFWDATVHYPSPYGYRDDNRSIEWAMRLAPTKGFTYVKSFDIIYGGETQTHLEFIKDGIRYDCSAYEPENGSCTYILICQMN